MELGHLLTRSGLTYPEVSSKVCHDSFCQLGNSVSLPWVIYYGAFYLHVVRISVFTDQTTDTPYWWCKGCHNNQTANKTDQNVTPNVRTYHLLSWSSYRRKQFCSLTPLQFSVPRSRRCIGSNLQDTRGRHSKGLEVTSLCGDRYLWKRKKLRVTLSTWLHIALFATLCQPLNLFRGHRYCTDINGDM